MLLQELENAHPHASPVPADQGLQFTCCTWCGPAPWGRGCLVSPRCTVQGLPASQVFGVGCGQRHTALLRGLNKTSVCHSFELFIAFWCSLLQHFIVSSLAVLPCRGQQKCSLLLLYVFQLRLPNNSRSSQSTLLSDARPDIRALSAAFMLLVTSSPPCFLREGVSGQTFGLK